MSDGLQEDRTLERAYKLIWTKLEESYNLHGPESQAQWSKLVKAMSAVNQELFGFGHTFRPDEII